MNGITFEDPRDDSSADSSDHSASSRRNNSTFVKLPSMLSPSSLASTNDDVSVDVASIHVRRKEFSTSTETNEFKRPNDIDLTTTSKISCLPSGKCGVERPIPKDCETHVNKQQLGINSKKKATDVRSISNASENPYEIDKWIRSVTEVHAKDSQSGVRYRNQTPAIQNLIQFWPEKLGDGLRNGTLDLPPADIDLSVEEYARVMCSLMGIPVYDGHVVESVHVLLSLFAEMQKSDGMM